MLEHEASASSQVETVFGLKLRRRPCSCVTQQRSVHHCVKKVAAERQECAASLERFSIVLRTMLCVHYRFFTRRE